MSAAPLSVEELIEALQRYWRGRGCVILQPYDMEMGAGTFHPQTALRALGGDPWRAAYVQPCRRPADGRYGENPNRLQHYYQFQVVLKPSPPQTRQWYLDSLAAVGVDQRRHDVRFIEDDWESPTLGAWGLGWEIWCDGMEITQFTYFQQVGGMDCSPVTAELTYGLERLALFIQGARSVNDVVWSRSADGGALRYGDLFSRCEREYSWYNFVRADAASLERAFTDSERNCRALLDERAEGGALARPAWDECVRASHVFNVMDARGLLSVAERQSRIARIRASARAAAGAWLASESPPATHRRAKHTAEPAADG